MAVGNYKKGLNVGDDDDKLIGDPNFSEDRFPGSHKGVLDRLMPRFYSTARGHVPNKYLVYFYGPYVDEALHVMDRNSYGDKYNMEEAKVFTETHDTYKKSEFDDWFRANYDTEYHFLCMHWAAQDVEVPGAQAEFEPIMMDSIKNMTYQVIKKNKEPDQIKITVLDDNYMMWFQFFNALYNVQFSPLVLKPRSTFQKINMFVNFYYEGITIANSHDERTFLKNKDSELNPCITDLEVGQMFEFNSCVLAAAPRIKMSYGDDKQYTFDVALSYPNSFQGSFKSKFRYLRDNTTKGVSSNGVMGGKETESPYGEYNKGFYENTYPGWQGTKDGYTFETYNPTDYEAYKANHPAVFPSATKMSYDIND